jgi:hypothetical protein
MSSDKRTEEKEKEGRVKKIIIDIWWHLQIRKYLTKWKKIGNTLQNKKLNSSPPILKINKQPIDNKEIVK